MASAQVAEEKFNTALDELKKLAETYEVVTKSKIPHTIKQAREEGWQLVVNGIEVAWITEYEEESLKQDKTRIVDLEKALVVIREMEDKLIEEHVTKPSILLWKNIAFYGQAIKFAWDHVGEIWDVVWSIIKVVVQGVIDIVLNPFESAQRIAEILAAVWDLFLTWGYKFIKEFLVILGATFGVKIFHTAVVEVFKRRDDHSDILRKKAFPQAKTSRVRRRKEAR